MSSHVTIAFSQWRTLAEPGLPLSWFQFYDSQEHASVAPISAVACQSERENRTHVSPKTTVQQHACALKPDLSWVISVMVISSLWPERFSTQFRLCNSDFWSPYQTPVVQLSNRRRPVHICVICEAIHPSHSRNLVWIVSRHNWIRSCMPKLRLLVVCHIPVQP
jgi:hypothetical protein